MKSSETIENIRGHSILTMPVAVFVPLCGFSPKNQATRQSSLIRDLIGSAAHEVMGAHEVIHLGRSGEPWRGRV